MREFWKWAVVPGRLSLYLARADRLVIGADLTRHHSSWQSPSAHRFKIDRVLFLETDLHRPAFACRLIRRRLFVRRLTPHAKSARGIRPHPRNSLDQAG